MPPSPKLPHTHTPTTIHIRYVSPEVLANEPATPGVDLWAAGCLAYELLTGEPPFRGRSDYLTFQVGGHMMRTSHTRRALRTQDTHDNFLL